MHVIIDGYNLLKKIQGSHYISERERENFIKKINNYAHKKRLQVTLVFDGGPFQWPMQDAVNSFLTVVYSGAHQTADEYIKGILELQKNTEALLITSDRELTQVARRCGVPFMDSHDFFKFFHVSQAPIVQKGKGDMQQSHKITEKEHDELDHLMQTLRVVQKKEIMPEEKKKGPQLSKEERKLLKKIKKL